MNFMALLEGARSLGFGAAIGGALGAILYVTLPNLFPGLEPLGKDMSKLESAILIGALIGSGCHSLINGFAENLVKPVAKTVRFWLKQAEIRTLRGFGV